MCHRPLARFRRVAENRGHPLIALTREPQKAPKCMVANPATKADDKPKHTSAPWRKFLCPVPRLPNFTLLVACFLEQRKRVEKKFALLNTRPGPVRMVLFGILSFSFSVGAACQISADNGKLITENLVCYHVSCFP